MYFCMHIHVVICAMRKFILRNIREVCGYIDCINILSYNRLYCIFFFNFVSMWIKLRIRKVLNFFACVKFLKFMLILMSNNCRVIIVSESWQFKLYLKLNRMSSNYSKIAFQRCFSLFFCVIVPHSIKNLKTIHVLFHTLTRNFHGNNKYGGSLILFIHIYIFVTAIIKNQSHFDFFFSNSSWPSSVIAE